jgi:hypothetical protein
MTREVEKLIAMKISIYKSNSYILNNTITDSVWELINNLIEYTLTHPITSIKDIPEKFDPITKL